MSAISSSALRSSGESLTSGFRRRRLSWQVPSLVYLLAQCSMNASTSDCASASFPDSAFNNFLKSKTNGSPCSLKLCHPLFALFPPCLDFFDCSSTTGFFFIRVCAVVPGGPVKEQSIEFFFGLPSGGFGVHTVSKHPPLQLDLHPQMLGAACAALY